MHNTNLAQKELILKKYQEYLSLRNYSPRSVRTYTIAIRQFFIFLKNNHDHIHDFKDIDKTVLTDYQNHLYHNTDLSLVSQSSKLVGIRSLFSFLEKSDILLYDPTSHIHMPKLNRALPSKVLKPKDIIRVLNNIKLDSPLALRDRAILEILYSTGIRSFELSNLKLDDFCEEEGVIRVLSGKGNKDRVLPIGLTAKHYTKLYINLQRSLLLKNKTHNHLFLSSRGNKLSSGDIPSIIKKHSKKMGVNELSNARILRHSVATHMLKNGANIRLIQELLGHTSLDTTQIYTKVTITDLKKIHKKTHPREVS